MVLDKMQIRAIFLYEFKIGGKPVETAHKLNYAFGSGTVKKRTVKWWFNKFRSGNEDLEDDAEEGRERPSFDNDKLKSLIGAKPHTTIQELAEKLNVGNSTVLGHLKQLGKVKKSKKVKLNEKQ